MTDVGSLQSLLVAALGGAAIGVERQQSGHATGENARFGGVRTFTLLAVVSGIAGVLAGSGYAALGAVVVTGPVALAVAGYVAASRQDVDATTETAALVAIAVGLLAGIGERVVASGITAITVLLLVEKSRLHALIARVDTVELRAAARFAVMAVVILPLLPPGPFDPFAAVRPRAIWLLVLFFTGLSFTGYIARRFVGPGRAYPVTGALAGLVSSTSATLTFARLSRTEPGMSRELASGAIAASTVLFPRVLIAATVLDRHVAMALLPYLVLPFAAGAAATVVYLRNQVADGHGEPRFPDNPLQVWPALQMAAVFQVVLIAVAAVRQSFGETGLFMTGAVLGLTDVDALTISMSRSAAEGIAPQVAARAIGIGVLANCVLKAAVAGFVGSRAFSVRTAGALVAMAAALGVMLARG
jgi:uncharacterized membrane protein (DUF4010 family)